MVVRGERGLELVSFKFKFAGLKRKSSFRNFRDFIVSRFKFVQIDWNFTN